LEGGLHLSNPAASQTGAAMAVACTKALYQVAAIATWDFSNRASSNQRFRNARPIASAAGDNDSDRARLLSKS